MTDSIERTSVCAATMSKYQGKPARLIGRVIQSVQPGPQAKVQVYAGPGNPVTVTANLESRIENLVEFVGTVTSPTTLRADKHYIFTDEIGANFDLETYCDAIKYTTTFDNPWTDGLS